MTSWRRVHDVHLPPKPPLRRLRDLVAALRRHVRCAGDGGVRPRGSPDPGQTSRSFPPAEVAVFDLTVGGYQRLWALSGHCPVAVEVEPA